MEYVEPMASALFSSRRISPESGPYSGCPKAAGAANKNKTITICLLLGLILGAPTRFFRPFQKQVDPAFHVWVLVTLKMQFRDAPELQSQSQLPPQKLPGMFQRRQRLIHF